MRRRHWPPQRGMTLIELIVFIVIVSVAVTGILAVFNVSVRASADPLIRKQMLAVAEAMMSEITLHPFTYCDPSDGNVRFANAADTAAGNCTTPASPPAAGGKTRYSAATPFDNVGNYQGFTMTPDTRDLTNTVSLAGFSVSVAVTEVGGGAGSLSGLAASAVLQIAVTVSHGADTLTLTGYRFRHSPNAAG